MPHKAAYLLLLVLMCHIGVQAQTDSVITIVGQGAAPSPVTVEDVANDGGEGLHVRWTPTSQVGFTIYGYRVMAAQAAVGPYQIMATTDSRATEAFISSGDGWKIEEDIPYFVKVVAVDSTMLAVPDSSRPDSVTVAFVKRLRLSESVVVGPTIPRSAWFNWNRLNIFLMVVLFYAMVMIMVKRARAGAPLTFRRIAGIAAIDEAIGRATELGKPVLYVPGTQNIENIQTIASIQ